MQHTQTFQAGMVQDVDPHMQPANTYRSADNVQLMYNPDEGDVTMGHGMAIMNPPGNRRVAAAREGFTILGEADCSKGTLLFSTNNVDCEISLWYWDSGDVPGAVEVLYSDAYDPNLLNVSARQRRPGESGQDRLGWKAAADASMDIEVSYENELTERVYWTDRNHCIHTFNLNDAWNSQGIRLHKLAEAGALYPKYWSVHAFRDRSDLTFPRTKFKGRGKGRLLSGVYQIAVQYQDRNGHESVWSMLTRRVFVTTNALDDDNAARQTALRANHHHRVMDWSGIMTSESLRFELSGLDVRWEKVRVAVVYHQSPEKPFRRVALRPITIAEASVVVEIKQLDGDELNDAAFSQRYENMLSVGTMASSNNQLLAGNLRLLPSITMETGNVRFAPVLRTMEADQTKTPQFTSKANSISNRNDNDPITNSAVTNAEIKVSSFSGQSESHSIDADFANYKGQQYDHLLKGYFRGETAEFGVLVLDRSGQPMFVQPLPDFTFPEQYHNGPAGEANYYGLTKLNSSTGRYDLQIMGLMLSGLALPVAKLYDQDGRLNVSGFMIVRRKRKPTVMHQGVVFPVCTTAECWIKQDRDNTIYPLVTHDNGFTSNSIGDDRYQNGTRRAECGRDKGPEFGPAVTQPYYLLYHSPDVLIEEGLKGIDASVQLKHVGVVGNAYTNDSTELIGYNGHHYTKNYNTRTDFTRLNDLTLHGRPALGDTSRIRLSLLHNLGFDETYKEFDKDLLKLKLETQTHPLFRKSNDGNGYRSMRTDALLQRNAVLLKASDWKSVDVAEQEPTDSTWQSSYRIVSFVKPVSHVAADKEPYFGTGHYQPITEQILKLAKERYTDGKLSHYVFDDVEVWGGNCYPSLFDFTRLYPFWSDGCDGDKPDYAISLVVPIESKYNLALRWGRSFAANATKPQATSCDNVHLQFMNGITSQQPEDWKYNEVLNLEETVQFYNAKDPDLQLTSDLPSDFGWTPEKSSGQRLDAWRTRYVGDIGKADGSCGPITKLSTGSFSHVYVWQTKGLGAAPLNASNFQATETGTVVVSSGKTFQGMVYLTKESGTQHPSSVWVSKGQLGAWDARAGVLLRHSQAGLDELSKLENINDSVKRMTIGLGASDLNTLKRWNATAGVNDNGDVLISFSYMGVGKKTVVYSPTVSAFIGTLPMMPRRYGRRGQYLFSQPAGNGANQIWLHQGGRRGQYFGINYPSVIRFIVNVAPTTTKRFDNARINVNVAGYPKIAKIRQYTPNGGAAQDHTILSGDERMEWRNNELVYPMHEMDWDELKQPLRDHYAVVEITIDNTDNVPVELLSFSTSFLPVQ